MSILGAVVRVRPADLEAVRERLRTSAGVELAIDPGDGRLILVIEDALRDEVVQGAADTLDRIGRWPEVLNASLVYEYSGPDAPPVATDDALDYRAWRGGRERRATSRAAPSVPVPVPDKNLDNKEPEAWS